MRDQRFKAIHRGGSLDPERHRLLAIWAADCAEHVLHIFSTEYPQDDRPAKAIAVARQWAKGETTVGAARTASVASHAAARDVPDGAARAVARAAGHAVASAHMADHSKGSAWYALKAVRAAAETDPDAAAEREHLWQIDRLPAAIRELILADD